MIETIKLTISETNHHHQGHETYELNESSVTHLNESVSSNSSSATISQLRAPVRAPVIYDIFPWPGESIGRPVPKSYRFPSK
jgi:hypothetical protein